MRRAILAVVVAYGLWVLFNLYITIFQVGDGGVAGHLGLIFTGIPTSLLSLWLPNGSFVGVLAAGMLGLGQWLLIVWFVANRKEAKLGP